MKIVTWNCNLKLKDKYEHLVSLNPDIAIVQECEQMPEDYFSGVKYHWIGQNAKKGLGVLDFTGDSTINDRYNPHMAFFLPINLDGTGRKLLATWAFNHRAQGRFGESYNGRPLDAFSYYDAWMSSGDLIVAGDFNNSVVWDKPRGKNNFTPISAALNEHGLVSAYHDYSDSEYGKESHPTLFHTKNQDRPYHIDYVFIGRERHVKNVTVGQYEDWIRLSDHVPVIVETAD